MRGVAASGSTIRLIPILLLATVVSACQPSLENRSLSGSGMAAEDAKFYPSDVYVRTAKVYFHNQQYGLAAKNYQNAVEVAPEDLEAWLGLAASYDELRRFDLSDKAYAKVMTLGANNPIVLNNAGYSQLLRGNLPSARRFLLRAYELDPNNPVIKNNVALLGESGKTIKRADL
jgi:Flp pilus assembly protein TadD